jgi:mono/diheme cytochrome c family protein
MLTKLVLAVSLAAGAGAVAASYKLPPETATLRPAAGKGFEAAKNHCLACHSADYPGMQPPGKPKTFWEAEVSKMIIVYKAKISEEDAKAIAQYLSENY